VILSEGFERLPRIRNEAMDVAEQQDNMKTTNKLLITALLTVAFIAAISDCAG